MEYFACEEMDWTSWEMALDAISSRTPCSVPSGHPPGGPPDRKDQAVK